MPPPACSVVRLTPVRQYSRIRSDMESVPHIEGLNRRFSIAGTAQVVAGKGGLPVVRINSPAAHAEISLYGAQVLSWRPAGAEEVIFLSDRSHWEPGVPIRGGIPVCFPWFGNKADDPKAPKHGFARTREWRLDSLRADDDGSVTLVCLTSNDDSTRTWWPHDFLLAYRIRIAQTLRLELSVVNRGADRFRFEEALHTYFRVGRVQQACVRGLDGVAYLDKTDGFREKRKSGDLLIAGQTDNAYMDTEGPVEIVDSSLQRRLRTDKLHSCSTVVWNPWHDGAATLSDFGEDEWESMLCVEAGNVMRGAVTLAPGEEHMLRATISVLPQ
jgi:glucose-6-phosphate 1-epimerase